MAKMMNPTKVVTGVCRFSYANLWEPKAMDENSKAKYSVSLIIPKSDTKTLDKIRAAIQAAYEEGRNKLSNGKSVPPLTALKTPLRHSEVYSGIYGRASINFYAYNAKASKGIACGLQNVQKIRDGEPLGGHSRAEDDFDDDFNDFLD